jgi:hypothetical protein
MNWTDYLADWCTWCDRPRTDCMCHADPNGIPPGHWSKSKPLAQIDIRKGIDDAINKLYSVAGLCNSEPVKLKLKSARDFLRVELELIDVQVIRALESEAA